jgi:hypothetical protein
MCGRYVPGDDRVNERVVEAVSHREQDVQAAAVNRQAARARESVEQVEGLLLLARLFVGAEDARGRALCEQRGLARLGPLLADVDLRGADGSFDVERLELGVELSRQPRVVQLDAAADVDGLVLE